MPFKSQAQKGWMYANKPEMAKEWQAETPKGKALPKKISRKRGTGGMGGSNPSVSKYSK